MTDNEFVSLYKNSSELTPPSTLKDEILTKLDKELKNTQKKENTFSFRNKIKIITSFAVCFVFVFLLVFGVLGIQNYETIYIDVNPSIAVDINSFGVVKAVEYLNEDASNVFSGVKFKGLAIEDAFEKIINTYKNAGYFEKNADIYISLENNNNKKENKILQKLIKKANKIKGNKKYKVNVLKITSQDKANAKKYNISPAKYHLIYQIIEKEPNYTIEQLKNKSMAELKSMIG